MALLIAIIHFTSIGFHKLGEMTGYGQKESVETEFYEESEDEKPVGETMIITESSANIRSGAGTDYDVVMTATQGQTFVATGNQETAANGRIWYEIYLNEEMIQTGWASEKVIDFQ